MKTFDVWGSGHVSVYVGRVKAKNKDEARNLMIDKVHVPVCVYCSKVIDEIEIDELEALEVEEKPEASDE